MFTTSQHEHEETESDSAVDQFAVDEVAAFEDELLPLAAVLPSKREVSRMQIVGGLVGNTLEWYDFAVFGYLAEPLAENFARGSHFLRLVFIYSIFAAAFFARPFGGVVFGKLGDKMGRKFAVTLAMGLMFSSTFLIGCLPTYDDINSAAPLLLLLLRMCQGFSAGGQIVGSILIFLESARKQRRGSYASLVEIAGTIGTLLGAATVAICKASFSDHSLDQFAWRIPFLLSGLLGTVSLIPQLLMEDSGEFGEAQRSNLLLDDPLTTALRVYSKEIVAITLVMAPTAAAFYIDFIWLPNYISENGYEHALTLNVAFCALSLLFELAGGYLSDVRGWRQVLWSTALLNAVLAVPTFYAAGHWRQHWWALAILFATSACIMCIYDGGKFLLLNDLVDSVAMRYTVVGISYNLGVCLFGGTAPLVSETLAQFSVALVGVYQTVLCLVAMYILHYVLPPLFESRKADKSRHFCQK